MSFVHDSEGWADLLLIVARDIDRDLGMVEKDYWVTHTLWALHDQGFDVWFKGGTSLSKGFDLIHRFSEDIDARIDAGSSGLQGPRRSWNNVKSGIPERDAWFDAIATSLKVPGCDVARDPAASDDRMRSAGFTVHYPAHHLDRLPEAMRPFVLLEVGRARVTPFVARDLSSWVHDHLDTLGLLGEFTDNRPRAVRCIHPWVTALEKLEAIARRFDQGRSAPDFVRHYEDTARILAAWDGLPPCALDKAALVRALAEEDGKPMPPPDHPAFLSEPGNARWEEIQRAWEAIGPMYWGPRVSLEEACQAIRAFLVDLVH